MDPSNLPVTLVLRAVTLLLVTPAGSCTWRFIFHEVCALYC